MQPIIWRTITITIIETWTITWPDGDETVWTETHELTQPAIRKPGESLLPISKDKGSDDSTPAPDNGDSATDNQ